KATPYLVAIVLFALLSIAYFSPILEGKKLIQGDIARFKGMAKEIQDHREMTGEEALWTGGMFSGMPAYMTSVKYKGNLVSGIDKALQFGLPHPANYMFLYFLGFFILLLAMRVNPWISILGALAFALTSYNLIIIEAGHNTKAHAIAYMAPVIAGIILTYRRKYLLGAALTALFLALELRSNHLQMTYYLLLIVIVFGIFELVETIRTRQYQPFIKATAILVLAAFLAVGTHYANLSIAAHYAKFSTRGKSELTFDKENKTTGLDKDYITDWSYGVGESFTLIIPDFAGGVSGGELSGDSETYKALVKNGVPVAQARQAIKQMPVYWGPQPFTSGPVYVGAIVFFLFIFGLFVVKGKWKWWLLTITVLSLFLAWGRNFMWFTDLFLDYFPGYDKFRAVSMTLVIAEFAIPLLGILALARVFKKEVDKEKIFKYLQYSLYIVGGLLLFFALFPGWFLDFSGPADSQLPEWLLPAIREDRQSLLRLDAFRSLVFVILTAGLLWAVTFKKLKVTYGLIVLGFLILADMWMIDRRYLNKDNFERKKLVENPYKASTADNYILNDKDLNFRVLNLTVNPFKDARTSYFHHSIGGYHGAKLGRYQELIEHHLFLEIQQMQQVFAGQPTMGLINNTLSRLQVLNMLNARYIIIDAKAQPLRNMHALGNAWYVDGIQIVEDANQEITDLGSIDPAVIALVDQRFEDYVQDFSFDNDSLAKIELLSYLPNKLVYESTAAKDQFCVFSEIY
ncbi:MAG: hypothetical protein U9R60_13090, partial [Bacteroidota bacterium]|nr:hypothetical protein [Bacteroidota bacterium]